jgi:hypothetical protein
VSLEGDKPVGQFMQDGPARELAGIKVNDPRRSSVHAHPMHIIGYIQRKGRRSNLGPARSIECFTCEAVQFRAQQRRTFGIPRAPISDEAIHRRPFRGVDHCCVGIKIG